MISCNELRIGNKVLANHQIRQVSGITAKKIFAVDITSGNEDATKEYNLEKVDPVPLTDDLLKACGFTFHNYFHFWQLVTTDIRSEMNIDRDYNVIDFMRKPILARLVSLHQLQNIYFILKGRELTFTQKAVGVGYF